MLIETYFKQLQQAIEARAIIQSFNISFDKRGTYEGFIRGEVYFVDGSILHLREFVDVEISRQRLMYVYHYSDAAKKLVFRYDDTGHHQELQLPTFPHHKHTNHEDNIMASSAPDLSQVFDEIETIFTVQ